MPGNNVDGKVVFWDSCVFLGLFKREADKPLAEMEGIVRAVETGTSSLQLSAISFAEIFDQEKEDDPLALTAGTQFRQWVARSHRAEVLDVDPRISDRAAELKLAAIALKNSGTTKRSLKIPDALIVATAIIYRAHVLHSFDPDILYFATQGIFGSLIVERPSYPPANEPPEAETRPRERPPRILRIESNQGQGQLDFPDEPSNGPNVSGK